jgi:ligand-binding SRPBCC domain-containing protein
MARISLSTFVNAPPEACFDLARDVDFHASVPAIRHHAIAGVTSGRMEVGQTVTWEARQLGVKFHMTSEIIEMRRPDGFVDQMRRGPFGRWRHHHAFKPTAEGRTQMVDEVEFASPFGPLGRLVDLLYMRRHMEGMLLVQNQHLKASAEARR